MKLLDLIKQFGQANYNCGFFNQQSGELTKKYEIERQKYFNEIVGQIEPQVSQPSEPSFGQWIDVKDKLPEIDEPVLIYDGSGIAVARMAGPPHSNWWVNDTYGFAEDGLIPQVYKWMPLPKP